MEKDKAALGIGAAEYNKKKTYAKKS